MPDLYKCKQMCTTLSGCCHNTKNRVIELMCKFKDKECRLLGDYLQSLQILESLCNYMCLCCCEHESLSPSILSELKTKCILLIKQAEKICKFLDKKDMEYIRCNELKKYCTECKHMKKSKTLHR